MDNTLKAKIIKDILLDNAGGYEEPLTDVPVFDDEHKRYMLVTTGTEDNGKSVYEILCAVSIDQDGKIVVEYNRSDIDLKDMFLSEGIPSTEIV
jgi:hypothetical protein